MAAGQQGLQPQVFISHTAADDDGRIFAASILKPALETANVKVFIDDVSLPPGCEWPAQLVKEAATSVVFVVVLTKSYPTRPWCLRELDLALHGHPDHPTGGAKPLIIPVYYDHHSSLQQVSVEQLQADRQQRLDRLARAGKQGSTEWQDLQRLDLERMLNNVQALQLTQAVRRQHQGLPTQLPQQLCQTHGQLLSQLPAGDRLSLKQLPQPQHVFLDQLLQQLLSLEQLPQLPQQQQQQQQSLEQLPHQQQQQQESLEHQMQQTPQESPQQLSPHQQQQQQEQQQQTQQDSLEQLPQQQQEESLQQRQQYQQVSLEQGPKHQQVSLEQQQQQQQQVSSEQLPQQRQQQQVSPEQVPQPQQQQVFLELQPAVGSSRSSRDPGGPPPKDEEWQLARKVVATALQHLPAEQRLAYIPSGLVGYEQQLADLTAQLTVDQPGKLGVWLYGPGGFV